MDLKYTSYEVDQLLFVSGGLGTPDYTASFYLFDEDFLNALAYDTGDAEGWAHRISPPE